MAGVRVGSVNTCADVYAIGAVREQSDPKASRENITSFMARSLVFPCYVFPDD